MQPVACPVTHQLYPPRWKGRGDSRAARGGGVMGGGVCVVGGWLCWLLGEVAGCCEAGCLCRLSWGQRGRWLPGPTFLGFKSRRWSLYQASVGGNASVAATEPPAPRRSDGTEGHGDRCRVSWKIELYKEGFIGEKTVSLGEKLASATQGAQARPYSRKPAKTPRITCGDFLAIGISPSIISTSLH